MNASELKEVMDWLKSTDLVEVSYKNGERGFSLATTEAPPAALPQARFPNRYACVAAQSVGVFQPNALGRSRAEEGREVAEGDVLGLIDTGGKEHPAVKAPCKGLVAKVFVEPGQAVQYGQPLFLIDPK
jgi:acetyl-CoA carboxylase biotin carboxyl carrier protein